MMGFSNLKLALFDIGHAFTADLSVWWLIAPIVVLWIATEIYAGEYKQEAFSFSGLLAGAISLLWVNMVSVRIFFLLERDPLTESGFFALALFILYALVLIYIAFTHKISIRTARWIGRPSFLYFLSVLAVLWGQGTLGFGLYITADLLIIYALISIIFTIINYNLGFRGEVEKVKEMGMGSDTP